VITAPDYVTPTIGWRVWYALDTGPSAMLSSVIHRVPWPYATPLAASCLKLRIPIWPFTRSRRHEAPDATCRCGIYAGHVSTLDQYLPDVLEWADRIPVVGRVSLWGRVHEHDGGWRASFAYPETLFVPIVGDASRVARVIADLHRYRVPVHAVNAATARTLIDEIDARAAA